MAPGDAGVLVRCASRLGADRSALAGVAKTYHALVVGSASEISGVDTIRLPVDGLPSETRLEVLEVTPHAQWGALSTLRMWPHTGRTHQLRVHAAVALGCPIVGDDLYWPAAARVRAAAAQTLPPMRKVGGLFLQSCAVAFEHPDGRQMQVMVPEAAKFGALRARARSGAAWTTQQIQ